MAYITTRIVLILSLLCVAQTSQADEQNARWLNNLFRIDPSITTVTLLIERESGSAPVVLIRPDGSKYYEQNHPENISWVSTSNRDVITLWEPEPGPWQATGKINKERGVSLISEFKLAINTLPDRLYQHEILKLNAELRHGNTRLDANFYLEDLSLQARLVSLRTDPNAQFAPAPVVIGEFSDNGKGLDAYPNDGKLTAEAILDILPGEYLFQTEISNQVLARTQEQQVLIYPSPLKLSFTTPDEQGQWQMIVTADHEVVADSLVIIGELLTPARQRIPITGNGTQVSLPPAVDTGNYYWQGRAYATSERGREIQIDLAEQVIRVSPPINSAEDLAAAKGNNTLIYIIGGIVLLLLIIATAVWFIIRRKKAKHLMRAEE